MTTTLIHRARWSVGLVAVAILAFLAIFGAIIHLAPLAGRELFIITGGSMEPSIPVGSLVAATRTDTLALIVGDVVTIRADNGAVITHRVSRIVDLPDGRSFEVKGDANASPDGALVPARAIVGRVGEFVPFAGYLQWFLASPSGIVSALSLLGALAVMYVLLASLGPQRLRAESETPGALDTAGETVRP